jgi:hypothetical protein
MLLEQSKRENITQRDTLSKTLTTHTAYSFFSKKTL